MHFLTSSFRKGSWALGKLLSKLCQTRSLVLKGEKPREEDLYSSLRKHQEHTGSEGALTTCLTQS